MYHSVKPEFKTKPAPIVKKPHLLTNPHPPPLPPPPRPKPDFDH